MERVIPKLEAIKEQWQEIGRMLSDPAVISDIKRFVQLNREYRDLEPVVNTFSKYRTIEHNYNSAREMWLNEKDESFRQMAKEEMEQNEAELTTLSEEIKKLLVPKDPEDVKNAVVEIRGGAGGDEAAIFAGDLFKMYSRYCERMGWKVELMDVSEGSAGGYKEIIFSVIGDGAYGNLKYESGVHRVQRVPQTETQGRIHTSAAAVLVLPEAEEFDVEIKESDLRVDSFCSSGPGGQSVNTTYSAIRLTHIPTGIVAQCQDQKSKLKNYDKALAVLRSRIYEMELKKQQDADAATRKSLVWSSDRSAKIRTYNYPQGRVTDHRINFTVHNLPDVIAGNPGPIIEALKTTDHAERLQQGMMEEAR
jgi:peptide chain release factor 1